ncbi:NTP transferase domain-containing protein [Pseudarthrobacter sp. J1763]|uniref:NTP transferase domain-containing protein n=1 Tax=Pseudarthrobacter sp. J1763 TaxID=3420445 RepID=UPI003D284526
MNFDAIILAGGRSSRLQGVEKSQFVVQDSTLLQLAVMAARDAQRTVVVGPSQDLRELSSTVSFAREEPLFGGPVAGIVAGLRALGAEQTRGETAEWTLILACDMPHAAPAVVELAKQVGETATPPTGTSSTEQKQYDGAIAVTPDGRHQSLLAMYRTSSLSAVSREMDRTGKAVNASMRSLLASLDLVEVPVVELWARDLDTFADAAELGATPPVPLGTNAQAQRNREATMNTQDEVLEQWCADLAQALELEDIEVDVQGILNLAGVAAHSVVRPAAPLTTYLAGLAAGLEVGLRAGRAGEDLDTETLADALKEATDRALSTAKSFSREYNAE